MYIHRITFGFIFKLIIQNVIGYQLTGEEKPRPSFAQNNNETFLCSKMPGALLVFILFVFFLKTNQILSHSCFLSGPVLDVKGDYKTIKI